MWIGWMVSYPHFQQLSQKHLNIPPELCCPQLRAEPDLVTSHLSLGVTSASPAQGWELRVLLTEPEKAQPRPAGHSQGLMAADGTGNIDSDPRGFWKHIQQNLSWNWWPWRGIWDQFPSQSTQCKCWMWKGQDLAEGRVQLSYLMVCALALDQRLSWKGTTAGQTKWCWWQPSPATSFALERELFQHLVVLSCSVITSQGIIPSILCSKIWESDAESVTFRRVTAPAVLCSVTSNRTNIAHGYVQVTPLPGSSSCGIIEFFVMP